MANKLTLNPIVIDTFGANQVIRVKGVGPLTITRIIFYSASSGDRFALEDEDGNPIFVAAQSADLVKDIDFGNGHAFANGIVFDYDDALQSGLGAGDLVLIYLK